MAVTTTLTTAQLKTQLQKTYQASRNDPDVTEAVAAVMKLLIDLGVVGGVTTADVDNAHTSIHRDVGKRIS